MFSISPNQQTSTAKKFYAGLVILDACGVDTPKLVANLINNHPLAGLPTLHQAIAYGIYLHQHDYIPDWLISPSFSEPEIIFLQAIALNFKTDYPLDVDRYCLQLAKTCERLSIGLELQKIHLLLSKGHSVGTAQYKISDPILLGIYLFLYSPYSWQNCKNMECQYHLGTTVILVASSLIRIFLGSVSPDKTTVKEASDRLYKYWSGYFNF